MKEYNISLDPSNCEIMGIFGDQIYIKELNLIDIDEEDFTEEVVIIKVKDKLFKKMWDKWITGKKKYCESYSSFCGVMGYFYMKEYKETTESVDIDEHDEDGKVISTNKLLVIEAISFDMTPDFERG